MDQRTNINSNLIIHTHTDITKNLFHSYTCVFFIAALLYASSSICNVSEVNFCSKTQNDMFLHWSKAQVTLRLTVGQSVSMSWYRTPLWDLQPDITSCLKFAVLFLWGALSDGRTDLQLAV
jgi:hypothetical protein